MKKTIVSVVLLLAMLLSLTACGSTDADKLVGTWKCEMDLADQINEEMALDAESAEFLEFDSFEIVVYMEFNKDGTYSMYADESILEDTLDAAIEDFADGMAQYLEYMVYSQSGVEMSAEEILAVSGMTMDDMMAEAFPDDMAEDIASDMNMEGNFEAKDGKLFTSIGLSYKVDPEVYETYVLDGDTLTITGYVGDDADDVLRVYPLVFKKN